MLRIDDADIKVIAAAVVKQLLTVLPQHLTLDEHVNITDMARQVMAKPRKGRSAIT